MLGRSETLIGRNSRARRTKRLSVEPLEERRVLAATLGGAVWLDANGDGIHDTGELPPALAQSYIELYRVHSWGNEFLDHASIYSGQYAFGGLPAGDYAVGFSSLDPSVRVSPSGQTLDEAHDSDVDPSTLMSDVMHLDDGDTLSQVDVGLWRPAYVEGDITFSGAINGTLRTLGIAGAKVTLVDGENQEQGEFVTEADGHYWFAEVPPGEYFLKLRVEDGLSVAPNGGDVGFDSTSMRTPTVTLLADHPLRVNAPLTTNTPAAIGGRLWHDLNADGVQDAGEPGIEGRRVGLLGMRNELGNSVTTDHDGYYHFDGLPPARYQLYIEQYVFSPYEIDLERLGPPDQSFTDDAHDSDFQPTSGQTIAFDATVNGIAQQHLDGGLYQIGEVVGKVWNDIDHDGVQDVTEGAVSNATVHLFRANGALVATKRTGPDGSYRFENQLPGTYYVQFVRPDWTLFAPRDIGSDETDSDADPASGITAPRTLSSGGTISFGAGLTGQGGAAMISGRAWNDANGDGIRQPAELPMGGVVVELISADGAVAATTTTDPAGAYRFMNLAAGGYEVAFTPPAGATLSPQNRGTDDHADSDANRSTRRTSPLPLVVAQQDGFQDVGIYTGPLSNDTLANLRITEVGFIGHDHAEFTEVRNIGTTPIDLTGVRFTNGIRYDFSAGMTSLFPGEYGVIAGSLELLAARADLSQINVLGLYSGDLDRSERLTLVDASGATIHSFKYRDEWFVLMDRELLPWTLTVVDDTISPDLWGLRSTWRPSSRISGSPGSADPHTTPDPGAIVINEVLTKSLDGHNDLIELRNTTDQDINIGGWYLGDSNSESSPLIYLTRYRIPQGTIVPANGYLVLSRDHDFGVFGLSSYGETLNLIAGDEYGAMAGYAETISFGGTEIGVSFGRYENATGDVDMAPQLANTFGAVNTAPRNGPVVISEIMYHPAIDGDEYIELLNTSSQSVALGDASSPWAIAGGVTYRFPQGAVMPAGGRALVTPLTASEFRAKYAIPSDVLVLGPWSGTLDNAGEPLDLVRTDGASERRYRNGEPSQRTYSVDHVKYDDAVPWPSEADVGGLSLERLVPGTYGNEPNNWAASTVVGGTPGAANSTTAQLPGDCNGDGTVSSTDIDVMTIAVNSGTYDAHYDLNGNGMLDTADRNWLITLIGVPFGDANLDGAVRLGDMLVVQRHLGQPGGWAEGDFTGDGMVDRKDLVALLHRFGSNPESGASPAASAEAVVVTAARRGGEPTPNGRVRGEIAATRRRAVDAAVEAPRDESAVMRVTRRSATPATTAATDAALKGMEPLTARTRRSTRV